MDILSLQNLLSTDNDGEEVDPLQSHNFAAASASGPISKVPIGQNPDTWIEPTKASTNDDDEIWGADEVPHAESFPERDATDSRPQPKYEFFYKQCVDSSDVYLGLADKSPGSSDCDTLVVKVFFPRHKLSDLDLDVKKNSLRVESDKFCLRIYLPQSVNSDEGAAKFDIDTGILSVTLPILYKDW